MLLSTRELVDGTLRRVDFVERVLEDKVEVLLPVSFPTRFLTLTSSAVVSISEVDPAHVTRP